MGNEKLITLVNGIEDVSEVELLCAFEIDEYQNKYMIYTKNEKDNDGHTIIYAGRIISQNDKQYLMNIDNVEEWDKIKDIMKEMARYNLEGDLDDRKY